MEKIKRILLVVLVSGIMILTGIPILFNSTPDEPNLPSKDEITKLFYEHKDTFQRIVDIVSIRTDIIYVAPEGKYWRRETSQPLMNASDDYEILLLINKLEKTKMISGIYQWDREPDKVKIEFYGYYSFFDKNTEGYNVGIMYMEPDDLPKTMYKFELIEGNWYYYIRPISSIHFFNY